MDHIASAQGDKCKVQSTFIRKVALQQANYVGFMSNENDPKRTKCWYTYNNLYCSIFHMYRQLVPEHLQIYIW